MAHKFKLIFLLSLTLFSILGTTSFALTDSNKMDEETMSNILNYFKENSGLFYAGDYQNFNNIITGFIENVNMSKLTQDFNNNVDTTVFPYLENMTISVTLYQSVPYLTFYTNNNTIENNLPFVKIEQSTISYIPDFRQFNISYINSNLSSASNKIMRIRLNNGGDYSFQTLNLDSNSNRVTGTSSSQITYNSDSTIVNVPLFISLGINNTFRIGSNWYLQNNNQKISLPIVEIPPDDTESGDSDESGDAGGGTKTPDYSEDLENIQGSLNDIKENISTSGDFQNIISGEVGKVTDILTNPADFNNKDITNEDITSNLDFEFMEDPYSNFWFELTTGLSGALTNNIRTLDINWLGHIYTIDLDKIGLKYPPSMELILKSTSTVAIVWVLAKWWKIIVDKLSSGNMDEVLAMNEEERNC